MQWTVERMSTRKGQNAIKDNEIEQSLWCKFLTSFVWLKWSGSNDLRKEIVIFQSFLSRNLITPRNNEKFEAQFLFPHVKYGLLLCTWTRTRKAIKIDVTIS